MATGTREDLELNALDEEELWEMIERHRYKIVKFLSPARLTPYLRQARVMDHLDEEEVLHNSRLTNSAMRAGHLLDLLQKRGKNGAIAFLESLKLHKPEIYTTITGKEPSLNLSSFSGLIETSKLTEFLVKAAESVQEELTEERRLRSYLLQQCQKQKEKLAQLDGQSHSLQSLEAELHRMRRDYHNVAREVAKLKEEKYELSMRYANAVQEKDLAMSRVRELLEQISSLKDNLHRVEMALYCEKKRSLRLRDNLQPEDGQFLKLKEENERLNRLRGDKDMELNATESSLLSVPPRASEENIYETCVGIQSSLKNVQVDGEECNSLGEAVEGRQELITRIHSLRERAENAEKMKTLYLEEKEALLIKNQKKEVDCILFKEKISALQIQVDELQNERDQAYGARDAAQTQSSQTRVEKDLLRRQILDLNGEIFELKQQLRRMQLSSHEVRDGSSLDQEEVVLRQKPKLIRMHAIYPRITSDSSSLSIEESWQDLSHHTSSELEESYQASSATPPRKNSVTSQRQEDYVRTSQSISSSQAHFEPDLVTVTLDTDFEFEVVPSEDSCTVSSSEGSPRLTRDHMCEDLTLRTNLGPQRRFARRIQSRDTIIAFQGDALLEQLTIIGGNETGIFIHQVTPGSAADEMSLLPGSQIMAADCDVMDPANKFLLEDVTREEAEWILRRVKGFCCLSIRYNIDRYRKLVKDLEKGYVTSGDSFYIRVNLTLEKDGDQLPVHCGDILHITDTMYQGRHRWKAHRVNPYTMRDTMESGTIPNYCQAQHLLITTIQDMTLQMATSRKLVMGTQKVVRVVSTARTKINPLWTSFDGTSFNTNNSEDDQAISPQTGSCFTLMPYTKVIPHAPTSVRPVLFVPSLVGKIMKEKLGTSRDFINCQSECLSEAEYESRHQRGDIISVKKAEAFYQCITRQTVHSSTDKNAHCLLDMSVDCVRALHQIETYPIILLIPINEKTCKRLKKYLHKLDVSEDLLLECSKREESCLDKLPCLYRTIPPDSWHDIDSLLNHVKAAVGDEQKRTVWIEQEPR
ncbi:caspase recruitment domain-containing protein 14 isoform X1 [Pleurodeles waltl]|uniref:caspase recruitment domain-containing protein 14 isoform X1 n=1 Tax=Pleurodeles waltl TaxID=8319 RepID=UPI0037097951